MGTFPTILIIMGTACQTNNVEPDDYIPLLGKWEAFDQKLNNLDDKTTRDLLLLRLAIQQPQYSTILCKRVISINAKEKCKQVIGRPHLSTPRSK